MKTKNINITFEVLVDYLQGKLNQEEEKMINFLLLSDEKKYWEFIGLRALKKADLLENYLNDDFLEEHLKERQITQKKLVDYIKNNLTLQENQKIKTILSQDEQTNFEFIKLKALFEEDELDAYLDSKNSFVDSILEKIQIQTDVYEGSQNQTKGTEEIKEEETGTKSVSLKTYLSFAASFVLLFVFSFLIYDYVQERQEDKKIALESQKIENNTQNNTQQNDYQTLGTNQNTENIKLADKLILYTDDALDIFMANLSIVAKKDKEQKRQNSELYLNMMKEYLTNEAKISVVLIDKKNKTIQFTDSEKFFDWLLIQEKSKTVLLRDYTAFITESEKQTNKVIIKNGKIENSVPSNFSNETNFKIHFDSLVFEIE